MLSRLVHQCASFCFVILFLNTLSSSTIQANAPEDSKLVTVLQGLSLGALTIPNSLGQVLEYSGNGIHTTLQPLLDALKNMQGDQYELRPQSAQNLAWGLTLLMILDTIRKANKQFNYTGTRKMIFDSVSFFQLIPGIVALAGAARLIASIFFNNQTQSTSVAALQGVGNGALAIPRMIGFLLQKAGELTADSTGQLSKTMEKMQKIPARQDHLALHTISFAIGLLATLWGTEQVIVRSLTTNHQRLQNMALFATIMLSILPAVTVLDTIFTGNPVTTRSNTPVH